MARLGYSTQAEMKAPIVLISIFRETIIGGVAVHASNLYERIVEEGLPVEKINYATVFVGGGDR